MYSAVKLRFHHSTWIPLALANLFVACLANWKKVEQQPAEQGILLPTVAESDNKSVLPLCMYTWTRTVVQFNGLIKL